MIMDMDAITWNRLIATFPNPHILQTWQWGDVKASYGWKPIYKYWGDINQPDAAALILERPINFRGFNSGLKILYTPKGPLFRDFSDFELIDTVLGDLKYLAENQDSIFIKIDPDIILGYGLPDDENHSDEYPGKNFLNRTKASGWYFSDEQIQYRNTVLLDLKPSEDEILARMKQKTRYNIRLAGRKGVQIRVGRGDDFHLLYQMYAETSLRDGFAVRDEGYYQKLWSTFQVPRSENPFHDIYPHCEPLIAEVDGEPVAGVIIFRFVRTAYYMHGMSRLSHRNLMPNHLLQWEAIRRSKVSGCKIYDFWGAPEDFDPSDPMWGVFTFKQGFGGDVRRTIGAYDLPIRPFYYDFYSKVMPQILNIMRKAGLYRIKSLARDST